MNERFFVFNLERGGGACWWVQSKSGYTSNLDEAGQFTVPEAAMIIAQGDGQDFPIPATMVEAFRAVVRSELRGCRDCPVHCPPA